MGERLEGRLSADPDSDLFVHDAFAPPEPCEPVIYRQTTYNYRLKL